MPTAEIERWAFYVPEDWCFKDQGIGISYLEAPDGTKGMYAKTIALDSPKSAPWELADYVQTAHRNGFEDDPQADWVVAERRGTEEGELYRSVLDLLDKRADYRVLSIVLCDTQHAVQITMHDYLCTDYEATKEAFAEVERSIRKEAGAA